MKRPIAIGLSPNTEKDDVILAIRLLFTPWRYIGGNATKELERWFRTYFKVSGAIAFVNARSALYAILHVLGIGAGDEVLLQAFTCVAVPNAIFATGAKPIYIDIDTSLNIDPKHLEKHITKNTKAIIVQHTFAFPAQVDEIKKIAKKHRLYIIEDCAHTIGAEYKGEKLGTFGIAACFSFGRDKAFSSVFGGMVITNDKDLQLKLRSYEKQKGFPSYIWVLQQLLYNPVSAMILNFYSFFSLGKVLHFFLRRFRFFSYPVTANEKDGQFNVREVLRLPNALAELALLQVRKYKEFNQRRQLLAEMYHTLLPQQEVVYNATVPFLRFPFVTTNKTDIKTYFAKKKIFIGDWYNQVIDPVGVDLQKVGYIPGSCPEAEKMTKKIINLPTYPTMKKEDAQRVIEVLKEFQRKD